MQLCVACSATLDSGSIPSNSEKPTLPVTFECDHILCSNCARRKSLTTACILCHSAHDLLGSSSSFRSRTTSQTNPPSYSEEKEDGFVLGDDSDDEEEVSPPPQLSESSNSPTEEPPAYREDNATEQVDEKGDKREQCNLHYIKPDETLLGLAMKYKVEGPLLCRMNRLPTSTLSTTPHLLHTLPFLLLPPHAAPSTSTTPLLPPAEERKRLIVRRFQVQTRCADYGVAKAYVDQVFEKRKEEAGFVRANREARGVLTDEDEGESLREGGELEEACAAFLADERWENEQKEKAKGKGKGLFGSKLKSTGQVENSGKLGWSWR
ncbi:uncharacterized protein JCM6883_003395 [Sporobolomyces salmoneus]|uniref:uncharacterized protein n=1 Tax=Sporobolomyces salmoneus TaxID=183962 RepID=UPI00317C7BAB